MRRPGKKTRVVRLTQRTYALIGKLLSLPTTQIWIREEVGKGHEPYELVEAYEAFNRKE